MGERVNLGVRLVSVDPLVFMSRSVAVNVPPGAHGGLSVDPLNTSCFRLESTCGACGLIVIESVDETVATLSSAPVSVRVAVFESDPGAFVATVT